MRSAGARAVDRQKHPAGLSATAHGHSRDEMDEMSSGVKKMDSCGLVADAGQNQHREQSLVGGWAEHAPNHHEGGRWGGGHTWSGREISRQRYACMSLNTALVYSSGHSITGRDTLMSSGEPNTSTGTRSSTTTIRHSFITHIRIQYLPDGLCGMKP